MKLPAVVFALTALAFAGSVAGPTLPSQAFAAEGEGASVDALNEAKQLRDEAKELFRTAGDTALDASERGKARKECYLKLKHARELLDKHVADHPADAERVDPVYVEVASMMFWVKKEMTLTEVKEVTGQGGAPVKPDPAGGGNAGGSGGGGIGGSRPKPPVGPPPVGPPPLGPTGGAQPPTPEPVAPEVPKGPSAGDILAEADAYAKAHPSDVPGQAERYDDFLSRFPDATQPEYAKAAETRKGLEDRMKDVYRLARDDDPDSIRSENEAEASKRLKQLLDDLGSAEPAVRARAAKLLGYLGSPQAVLPLIGLLRGETEDAPRDAASQALADLGGRRTFERLVAAAGRDASLTPIAVDVLTRAIKKGGPPGRLAAEQLALLAPSVSEERQVAILETLRAGDATVAVGLACAAATFAPDPQKAELIELAGAFKDARCVPYFAKFLFTSATGRRRDQATAAREAIEGVGKPAVRYLIPALDDSTVQMWAAEELRKITGVRLKDDKRKTWETWFRANRKTLE